MTTDPRTRRTTTALRAALRESLSRLPLDDISVSELCRAAGDRRTARPDSSNGWRSRCGCGVVTARRRTSFDPVAVPFAAAGLAGSVEAWTLTDHDDDPVAWAESVRDQMAPWWPR